MKSERAKNEENPLKSFKMKEQVSREESKRKKLRPESARERMQLQLHVISQICTESM